jgi:divalent metal cation (Fe/Co/Zn/Cd) transporter
MNEQPIQDKAVIAVGTVTSAILGLQWVEAGLALIIAAMTALLIGLRIYLAIREIRHPPASK